MSTFTSVLGLARQAPAENPLVWGGVWNTQVFDLLDQAVAGSVDISMTAGNVTLTDENGVSSQARNMILVLTGTPPVARTVFVPLKQKLYVIDNQTGQSMTVKTSSGIGVVIDDGEIVACVVDSSLNQVFKMVLQGSGLVSTAVEPGPSFSADFYEIVSGVPVDKGISRTFYYSTQGAYTTLIHDGFFNWTTSNPAPSSIEFRNPSIGAFPVPGSVTGEQFFITIYAGGAPRRMAGRFVSSTRLNFFPWPDINAVPVVSTLYQFFGFTMVYPNTVP